MQQITPEELQALTQKYWRRNEQGIFQLFGRCMDCGEEYTFSETRLKIEACKRCERCQLLHETQRNREKSKAYYYRKKALKDKLKREAGLNNA